MGRNLNCGSHLEFLEKTVWLPNFLVIFRFLVQISDTLLFYKRISLGASSNFTPKKTERYVWLVLNKHGDYFKTFKIRWNKLGFSQKSMIFDQSWNFGITHDSGWPLVQIT